MNRYIKDIREKTAGMSKGEKADYILTYYWYHILGVVVAVLLIVIFAGHFLFGEKRPLFSCVIVNRVTDDSRDDKMAEEFAAQSGLPQDRISIDSNYIFSYKGVRMQGVNESYYDKFFLRWSNSELDAVILEEDFYKFCRKMDGTFRNLDEFDTGTLPLYEDGGVSTAIVLTDQERIPSLWNTERKKLLLAFPNNGKHETECQQFIDYIKSTSDFIGEEA